MIKIIITVTILAFLNLIGCYYQEQMNPSEYKYDEKEELWLTTKDTTYNLGGKDYYLENDTLIATFRKKLDRETTLITNVEIPVETIKTVEVERTDGGATFLVGLGVVVGVFVLIAAVSTDFFTDFTN